MCGVWFCMLAVEEEMKTVVGQTSMAAGDPWKIAFKATGNIVLLAPSEKSQAGRERGRIDHEVATAVREKGTEEFSGLDHAFLLPPSLPTISSDCLTWSLYLGSLKVQRPCWAPSLRYNLS